ncbi:SMC-Scp complex subunit ScpB [Thioalkalivibrio sp.]|uniref:SMC-Scp complex subunit ScpB n=1 Tax=Thioalkalivibrio sp. TaxID=2093813 RepID=UPI0039759B0F
MVASNGPDPAPDPLASSSENFGLEQFGAIEDDRGISLDELSQAYAALIGKGEDPYEPPQNPPATGAEQILESIESDAADDSRQLCPKAIIEAVLFVGHPRNEPMSSEQLAGLMRGVPAREVDELVGELNAEYQAGRHPYHVALHGGGYRLELREEFSALRNVFYGRIREARLSQAAIDVLAIVAYQQGRTRQEVDAIRGRGSGGILSQLVRRRLLRIERTHENPRSPRYFVTDRFLDVFGLENIEELPRSPDMD